MKLGRCWILGVVSLSACILGGAAMMDGQDSAGMSPEMARAWMEFSTPGSEQKQLAKRAGTYKVTAHSWSAPGAEMMVSQATATFTMQLDGRFLQQDYKGSYAGAPFDGFGLTGYNNQTERFQFIWADSMGTGMMYGQGGMDGDTLQWRARATDPLRGVVPMWGTETFDDPDRFVSTMYMNAEDGREFKVMEIIYEREPEGGPDGDGHHGHHGHDHHDHDHHGHDHH